MGQTSLKNFQPSSVSQGLQCYASAMQVLCKCYASAMQVLCKFYSSAMQVIAKIIAWLLLNMTVNHYHWKLLSITSTEYDFQWQPLNKNVNNYYWTKISITTTEQNLSHNYWIKSINAYHWTKTQWLLLNKITVTTTKQKWQKKI